MEIGPERPVTLNVLPPIVTLTSVPDLVPTDKLPEVPVDKTPEPSIVKPPPTLTPPSIDALAFGKLYPEVTPCATHVVPSHFHVIPLLVVVSLILGVSGKLIAIFYITCIIAFHSPLRNKHLTSKRFKTSVVGGPPIATLTLLTGTPSIVIDVVLMVLATPDGCIT